jgi:hypothetical protein
MKFPVLMNLWRDEERRRAGRAWSPQWYWWSLRALLASLAFITLPAKIIKPLRFRTAVRSYVCDTILEGMAQDLQDMAAELGELIQKQHAMVGQRHLARHRHVAPAEQPRIRDGVVGRATWTGRDPRRAVAGEAGDAVDARGLEGFRQGHGWEKGDEAPGPLLEPVPLGRVVESRNL